MRYQYYTSTKPIIIIMFFVVFIGDENVPLPFEKRVKKGNLNMPNINPYLVTSLSLDRSTYQKNNGA